MKKMYVFKKVSAEDKTNHLIAVLRKNENGEIELEPRLDDTETSQSYSIPILSAAGKDSEGKKNLRKWLEQFLSPIDNKPFMDMLLKSHNMKEYDEWEWLKFFNPDSDQLISFSESFPQNYLRHDLGLSCIDEEDAKVFFTNQELEDIEPDPDADHEDIEDFDSKGSASDNTKNNNLVRSDSFKLFDDEPRVKDEIDLKDFIKLQEKNLITDKTTIRNTFEALADISLKSYFNTIKDPMDRLDELSQLSNIALDELKGYTIYDIIRYYADDIKAHDKAPENYYWFGEFYNIIAIPMFNAIINKPVRNY